MPSFNPGQTKTVEAVVKWFWPDKVEGPRTEPWVS